MLQSVVQTIAVAAAGSTGGKLEALLQTVRAGSVNFNAQDIYQICSGIRSHDTLQLMHDADFMRGLAASFKIADQSVLSPFQTMLVTEVFARAQINVKPSEVMVPATADEVSPEALLGALQAMLVGRVRDERQMKVILQKMTPLLDEMAPTTLAQVMVTLSKLQCPDVDFVVKVTRRIINSADDLSPLDVGLVIRSACTCRGLPHSLLQKVLDLVNTRSADFQSEDTINVLSGLSAVGPKYVKTFAALVTSALERVESLDVVSLINFLVCSVTMEYRVRAHVEIIADAVLEVIDDASERDLTQCMIAMQRLELFTAPGFEIIQAAAMHFAPTLDPRNIPAMMDVCSTAPYPSNELMAALLNRAADCVRFLSLFGVGEILDILATYGPAKEHRIVGILGKHCRLRIDMFGPTPLANVCRGLSHLGYADKDFYVEACEAFFRWGFKDFAMLEPLLMGLCIDGTVSAGMVKSLGLHLIPMALQMSLHEIERANRYMVRLSCEDDYVFRALADRVRVFVKEVTAEMPEDLRTLLARGSAPVDAAP